MIRTLSYSEVSRALRCMAQWDFSYGGHLAGTALKAKRVVPILSEGRAWGAAVAAYHSTLHMGHPACNRAAMTALDDSLNADADRQREFGVHDPPAHDELRARLLRILGHYIDTAEPFELDPVLERQLFVPIPSRSGERPSSRYRLQSYLDGTRDIDGRPWLVEFKLRNTLTSVELIALSRQIRWYAWAYWQESGVKVAGVEVHERWNEVPKPARLVQGKRKGQERVPSHAKDQVTTVGKYLDLCGEFGVEPNPDTLAALRRRRWQQRVPIMFRDGELEEAGRELVSAAKLIRDLDSGELMPLRNAIRSNCSGCSFREICPNPDSELVDDLFERVEPKRLRAREEATV